MIKIIASRGTGKTAQMFKVAHEYGATIVCSYPPGLKYKAKEMGYTDLNFISYNDYLVHVLHKDNKEKYLVDELDELLQDIGIVGYNISID